MADSHKTREENQGLLKYTVFTFAFQMHKKPTKPHKGKTKSTSLS